MTRKTTYWTCLMAIHTRIRINNRNSNLSFRTLSNSERFFPKPYRIYRLKCCRGQHTFRYFSRAFRGCGKPFFFACVGRWRCRWAFCRATSTVACSLPCGVFRALPGNPLVPKGYKPCCLPITDYPVCRCPQFGVCGLLTVCDLVLWCGG